MKDVQLVIFDMDGLMLDTEILALNGWKHVAPQLGVEISDELIYSLTGLSRKSCGQRMSEHFGPSFDFEAAIDLLHVYVDNYFAEHGVPLKPGLINILDKLEEMGIAKCVATSTAHKRAHDKLSMAGIAHRFEAIVGGDQVVESKPAPDIFLLAAKTCGVDPAHCIVLEDSANGTLAAHRAGIRVIVVPDLIPPSDETRARAYTVCKSLFEASDIIQKLHQGA